MASVYSIGVDPSTRVKVASALRVPLPWILGILLSFGKCWCLPGSHGTRSVPVTLAKHAKECGVLFRELSNECGRDVIPSRAERDRCGGRVSRVHPYVRRVGAGDEPILSALR